jgi:hypothetical protein
MSYEILKQRLFLVNYLKPKQHRIIDFFRIVKNPYQIV